MYAKLMQQSIMMTQYNTPALRELYFSNVVK